MNSICPKNLSCSCVAAFQRLKYVWAPEEHFKMFRASLEIYVLLSKHQGHLRTCRELILDHALHITNISLPRHIPCSLFGNPCLNCLYADCLLLIFKLYQFIILGCCDRLFAKYKEGLLPVDYTKGIGCVHTGGKLETSSRIVVTVNFSDVWRNFTLIYFGQLC